MSADRKIKMRLNTNTDTVCSNCGTKYKYSKEMYDLMLYGEVNHICFDCVEILFKKLLTAQCNWQGKVKSKEDMDRMKRNQKLKEN